MISAKLFAVGILFHLVYIFSVFDIYFQSPIQHGLSVTETLPSDARRLVLIVGDGLRADKLFEDRMARAPFLLSVVERVGRWGVSHTRVPTESRPGHVAMIAGFYEDVSAVTRGWAVNPVEFDSVFNQSRHTWSFGSPDILPMFALGATEKDKVDTFMFNEHDEDFGKDGSVLDTWVFDKFEALFKNATENEALNTLLRSDKIVFFLQYYSLIILHLIRSLVGLDTNGHAYKPYSKEYLNNINLVDSGIKRVNEVMDSFYGDKKTAFVFTADHGMSDRGNHGDGHPDNTRTPLIAWGAGVGGPVRDSKRAPTKEALSWRLSEYAQLDVDQADISPLMSSLAGLPFAMNSVGVLPTAYLSETQERITKLLVLNAAQIQKQFVMKEDYQRSTEIAFKPFAPLKSHSDMLVDIEALANMKEYALAQSLTSLLIASLLDGIEYYHTYDWFMLRTIVTAGYITWMIYSTLLTVSVSSPLARSTKRIGLINDAFTILSLMTAAYFYHKNASYRYYLYAAFPLFFLREIIVMRGALGLFFKRDTILKNTLVPVMYIASMRVLVAGYVDRTILTPFLMFVGTVVPFLLFKDIRKQGLATIGWTLSCFLLSGFLLLPVEKTDSILQVLCGGLCVLFTSYVYSATTRSEHHRSRMTIGCQNLLVVCSMALVYATTRSLDAKLGLPLVYQVSNWSIAAVSILSSVAVCSQRMHFLDRLHAIFLGFAPTYILLSISYEVLFYCMLYIAMTCYLLLESSSVSSPSIASARRQIGLSDLARSALFLLFIHIAFFGTGNVASLSSFSLSSVYRFITVFQPFTMAALLILKLLIPFLLIITPFTLLNTLLSLPSNALFMLVVATCDVMTVEFLFRVINKGSWMEIGLGISHFVICGVFVVFEIALIGISGVLFRGGVDFDRY